MSKLATSISSYHLSLPLFWENNTAQSSEVQACLVGIFTLFDQHVSTDLFIAVTLKEQQEPPKRLWMKYSQWDFALKILAQYLMKKCQCTEDSLTVVCCQQRNHSFFFPPGHKGQPYVFIWQNNYVFRLWNNLW